MSLACRGLTHCEECGSSLGMNEFFIMFKLQSRERC